MIHFEAVSVWVPVVVPVSVVSAFGVTGVSEVDADLVVVLVDLFARVFFSVAGTAFESVDVSVVAPTLASFAYAAFDFLIYFSTFSAVNASAFFRFNSPIFPENFVATLTEAFFFFSYYFVNLLSYLEVFFYAFCLIFFF